MGTSASNPDPQPPPQAVAAANFQYPQQPNPHGAAAAAPAGQTLTRDQLRTLMRNGLDADLALNHFQMPRASAAPLLSAPSAAQPQQTVTLRNAMNLRRPTLRLVRCTGATAAGAAANGAAVGAAAAASASPLYAVRFVFDAECPVRVTVRFACTELVEALPPGSGAGGSGGSAATVTVGFAADERVYAPRTYEFGAGANQLFEQPPEHALDVSRLSPAQLTAVPAQRYFPLVVTLTKLDAAAAASDAPAPASAAATAGPVADQKGASASAGSSGGGSSGATNEVVRQSTFAAFVAVNATTLDVKALKQTIALASGVTFELQEIFGLEPKSAAGAPAPAAAGASASASAADAAGSKAASASSAAAAECVVCLSSARTTTVMPCRHMCLCTDCATVLRGQERARCPICRSPVESLLVLNIKPSK